MNLLHFSRLSLTPYKNCIFKNCCTERLQRKLQVKVNLAQHFDALTVHWHQPLRECLRLRDNGDASVARQRRCKCRNRNNNYDSNIEHKKIHLLARSDPWFCLMEIHHDLFTPLIFVHYIVMDHEVLYSVSFCQLNRY